MDDAYGTTRTIQHSKRYTPGACRPEIILQQQGTLVSVPLAGRMLMGRPTGSAVPDIPVNAPFVSRRHGLFIADGDGVRFTALKSTNGTYLNGRRLRDDETVALNDGDLLHIYAGDAIETYTDISMACAFSEYRIASWHELIKAQYDALTQLLNRKAFANWFDSVRMSRGQEGLCLFLMDVDRFKTINDTYGHENGDAALVTLSGTLRDMLGNDGTAGRWGGDEFVGAIFKMPGDAVRLLEALREKVEAARINDAFHMTVSVGVVDVLRLGRGVNLDGLVSTADEAMYAAKQRGRNGVVLYRPNGPGAPRSPKAPD